MKSLPYFKFYHLDWMTGSIELATYEEQGIFIRLCALIWKEGGTIKNDNMLHRRLRLDDAVACAIHHIIDRINEASGEKIPDGSIVRTKQISIKQFLK